MANSRVEKNKELYEELAKKEEKQVEVKSEEKPATKKPTKKKATKQEKPKVEIVQEETVVEVVENPEVVEEEPRQEVVALEVAPVEEVKEHKVATVDDVMEAKLKEQERLRKSRAAHRKSPTNDEYTAEMMQKNIKQTEGVNVREGLNLKKIRGARNNNWVVIVLSILLVLIFVGATVAVFKILAL